jgi:malate dehydrogenase (oxaloacetate-decarboxylating)
VGFDPNSAVFRVHEGGKLVLRSILPLTDRDSLSLAYTPGVAEVCSAIAEDESLARTYTWRSRLVAVVSDGTAVLGLGNIGPAAALPVMEGKAALFSEFAGLNSVPIVLGTTDPDEIVETVVRLAPSFGGINLEDISAPRCFEIEARLRDRLDIPVFHDDQHGTAIVVLAALRNALRVVDKRLEDVRIVVSGVGAAGTAIIRLLLIEGAGSIVAVGRSGILHHGEAYADPTRAWVAEHTNQEGRQGSLADAVVGADVFIGVSAPDILAVSDVAQMAPRAIVFALANPVPEVDPVGAAEHASVVATGRSDYPNQINNVLAFPGVFRGLLDAGARDITDHMMIAAAKAIADVVSPDKLNPSYIVPSVFDAAVSPAVASAVRESAGSAGNPQPA